MPIDGPIFAVDVSTMTGFAVGRPGARPESGVVRLRRKGEGRPVALGNFIAWLDKAWREEKPALVASERPFHLGAFAARGNAEDTVLLTYGLHGILEAMCVRFGLRHEAEYAQTIRKHFIGKARLGERAETKAAVIQRCHALGLMPLDCRDDNRADALAVWTWAEAVFAGRRPVDLVMFGERG